jgi:hypothetical protein
MSDQLGPAAGDGLEQALAVAIDMVLRRRAAGQSRAETLKALRWQLEMALAEAPVTGDALDAIAFRARLAALCDAEITRLEARVS